MLESKDKSHEITLPCSHAWEFGRALLTPWLWRPVSDGTSDGAMRAADSSVRLVGKGNVPAEENHEHSFLH